MKPHKLIRKVTIETDRTYIFRSRNSVITEWCSQCGVEVQMAGVEMAAGEIGASELKIYQLANSGALHFTESAEGRVLICLNSLRQ